jgi:hypothetical protein
MNVWENSKLRKRGSTARVHDHASDAARMGQSSGGTIYIYAGTVSGKQPRNLASKNMSRSRKEWTL